ncbi:hypothetical protein EVAR_52948_1 [Eumeta japonica]|uniref:Uncharacterized protein n=1 Tax=Eumeta variegata TaxID=151549 RepID=A0A4C1XUE3_EUMVA|nr:hypothetical protein EVAR_52948_1 [Eumeta japonica]
MGFLNGEQHRLETLFTVCSNNESRAYTLEDDESCPCIPEEDAAQLVRQIRSSSPLRDRCHSPVLAALWAHYAAYAVRDATDRWR